VNERGYREILGICEGAKEDKTGWSEFLKHLKERGLKGIRLITSDACIGLAQATQLLEHSDGLLARCSDVLAGVDRSRRVSPRLPLPPARRRGSGATAWSTKRYLNIEC
jgi:hypothetical protein